MRSCTICGVEENDTGDLEVVEWSPGVTITRPAIRLRYRGLTCSPECARTLVMLRAMAGNGLTDYLLINYALGDE